jgi:hypothetical protein
MAGRERDPEVLKSEAQELLKRAKSIEEIRFKQVGQYDMGAETGYNALYRRLTSQPRSLSSHPLVNSSLCPL